MTARRYVPIFNDCRTNTLPDVQTKPPAYNGAPAASSSPRPARRPGLALALWGGLSVLFCAVALTTAVESALHYSGVPIDGPFQLYNALRRIAAGYRPGVDFQFFHGLGIPYLHYWLFRAFGAGLRGSELARNLISPIVFVGVLVAFLRCFTGSWTRTLCLTATALALTFTAKISSVFFAVVFAINGMLGVRSALPILLPVALFLPRTGRGRAVAVGTVLGLALFTGTEQGLAATIAYLLVSCVAIARGEWRRRLIELTVTLALAALVLVTCLAVVGGVHGMLGALHYNFVTVPADQYWFFGSPPNVFISSWTDAAEFLLSSWQIGAAIALALAFAVVLLRRFWRAPLYDARRERALAVLPLYALLSCTSLLGVATPVYTQPCWRVLLLLSLLEWCRWSDDRDAAAGRAPTLGVPRFTAIGALVASIASVVTVPLVRFALLFTLPHLVLAHGTGDARFEVSPMWIETLERGQRVVDSHRGPHGEPPVIWSTYAGWIEARNNVFNPSFDYMIHALGPMNRAAYVRRFRESKPTLVQTVLPTFTQYEPWLENTNWLFYDELLRWYDVTSTTPWSIYWDRRATPAPPAVLIGSMVVPRGLTGVSLPPIPTALQAPVMLLEVEVDYDVHNPLGWLPVVGKLPRYLVDIGDAASKMPVSLDPFVRRSRFPIVVRAGQHPAIGFHTSSLLPGASLQPHALRVFVRPIDAANQWWLADLLARLDQ